MANYSLAFIKMLKHEGGYVLSNHKTDLGRETYAGISRRFHPTWSGWKIIDVMKQRSITNFDTPELRKKVLIFYKINFWNKVRGSHITNQLTAESIFDFAVNVGVQKATILAQLAIGVVADGKLGRKSLSILNQVEYEEFSLRYTVAKITRYAEVCNANKKQTVNLLGWINRTLKTAKGI